MMRGARDCVGISLTMKPDEAPKSFAGLYATEYVP